jgi:hypothetical protein
VSSDEAQLGKDVDISPELKEKIRRIQIAATLAGASTTVDRGGVPPAKYCHLYGSAFTACEMIARGHGPSTVMLLSKFAAWYYRVMTLSNEAGERQDDPNHWTTSWEQKIRVWTSSLEEVLHFGNAVPTCTMADGFVSSAPEPHDEGQSRDSQKDAYLRPLVPGKPGA